MVAAGRGRDPEPVRQLAARVLLAVGQHADDVEAEGVADGAQDRREVERLGGRVRDPITGCAGARHARHATTSSLLPKIWKYRMTTSHACPTPSSPGVIGLSLFASATPSPLYGTYRELWGFSPAVLTLVYATYAFGVLAALLLAGRVSDQVGRRPVLIVALSTLLAHVRAVHGRRLSGLAVRGPRPAGPRHGPGARRGQRGHARPPRPPRPRRGRPGQRRRQRRRHGPRRARRRGARRVAARPARAALRRPAGAVRRSPWPARS